MYAHLRSSILAAVVLAALATAHQPHKAAPASVPVPIPGVIPASVPAVPAKPAAAPPSKSTSSTRDPTFPACDTTPAANSKSYTSDDFPFYLPSSKGVKGACDVAYTEKDMGACLNPGWVHSGNENHCGRTLTATNTKTKKSVQVTVLDVCGAVAGSSFGCNDISFTEAAFIALGGDTQKGKLDAQVTWQFDK